MEASSEKKGPPGTFGPKLRQLRHLRHLSQEKLAEMVGCDVRSIRRWEQGKSIPDYENRHCLSKALGITLEDFNQLLQPMEEEVEEFIEGEVTILEGFEQPFQSVKEGDEERGEGVAVERVERVERVEESDHVVRVDSGLAIPYSVRQPQRRALLGWGGAGLAAMLAGGGVFYWFTRAVSAPSNVPVSQSQVYIFRAQQGAGIRDVEWSSGHDFIVCVDENNVAQVVSVLSNTNSSSRGDSNNTNNLIPATPAYSYIPTQIGVAVNCVTWCPDGIRLASPGAANNFINIWNAQDRVNTHFSYTFGTPNSIAWSYDSKTIAICGGGGMVSTWNAATGQFLRLYPGHKGVVWRVAWSFDNTYLATAGADGMVRIWDSMTGKDLLTYRGHRQAVFDVKWSPLPDASVVSASGDQTVRIWDPRTGKTKLVYIRHNQPVRAAEWSSNGQYIASAGDDTMIRVWDAATGKDYATYRDHTRPVRALSWSSFGMDLASGSADGTMRVRFVNI